ncbi:MAG: hypothetical protein BA867_03660 [Desulfobacterales bacterium S5133MH16]|nr:MAG: hypothetical protein BA867_03660 [Desulfobacterales bacterium S5133MH16]
MTDNNDPDKKIEGVESTEDEEIIELKEEAIDMAQDDEEIIDLLEATDEPDVEDEKEGVVAQEVESSKEIITLTEAMSDTPQEIEEIGEPIHITVNTSQEAEDLTDLNADLLEEPSVLDDELGEEPSIDQALSDDFVDSLGMELDSKEDVSEDLLKSEKVSDAQMEAALERVIKKMFYEKIDGILVEVIEKTVTREIERLKSILLQDAAGNEK